MALVSPNLDDRTWDRLIEEAKQRIRRSCPEWNDLTPHDPGMVFLELFAYLAEAMIYRLNRVPEKMYVEFLDLLGTRLVPPAAATVRLAFARERRSDTPTSVPRGTRVTIERGSRHATSPVFETLDDLVLPAGEAAGSVEVRAVHAVLVEGELLGKGSDAGGQWFSLRSSPVVAPIDAQTANLVVGVEVGPQEEAPGADELLLFLDRPFRLWTEVASFSTQERTARVYVADRATGTITFAPSVRLRTASGLEASAATVAAVPAAGREIRAWYRHGGGTGGNVTAHTLTVLKVPIPGVKVDNPEAASGGAAVESIENAIARGPLEFRGLERAITAFDYEQAALRSGAISRARAFTKLEEWRHATPGTVEVLLVPKLPDTVSAGDPVSADLLRQNESADALARVRAELDRRRPLGTLCEVSWTRTKQVTVEARVVVPSGHDTAGIRERVLRRLHRTICPVRFSSDAPGWGFGHTLHVSHVYEMCLAEPSVRFVDRLQIVPEHEPVAALAAVEVDAFQDDTWYVGSGCRVFRSQNRGEGWEVVAAFDGEPPEEVLQFASHPQSPGHVAVVCRVGDKFTVRASADCGTSWSGLWNPDIEVWDVAWASLRDGTPYLLLATDKGLYEVLDGVGRPVAVDPAKPALPLYAVAVGFDPRGDASVAVASQERKGVFLSRESGKDGTFQAIGAVGEDLRVLAFQRRGTRAWLWAGATSLGEDPGTGCLRWSLGDKRETPAVDQTALRKDWNFGACGGLVFAGARVLAATHHGGIVWIEEKEGERDPAWQKPGRDCGLPLAMDGRFAPIRGVAGRSGELMAITENGVYAGRAKDLRFADRARDRQKIALPRTMLFRSGEHRIEVVTEDEVRSGASGGGETVGP